jgi:hypothetical protein
MVLSSLSIHCSIGNKFHIAIRTDFYSICGAIGVVPFGVCISALLLHLKLSKNRFLLQYGICCRWNNVWKEMKEPFVILEKRRNSPWRPPSTLSKLRTSSMQSLRALRDIAILRSSSSGHGVGRGQSVSVKSLQDEHCAPPNTPRLGQSMDFDLKAIKEEQEQCSIGEVKGDR